MNTRIIINSISLSLKGTEYKITVQGIGPEDRNAWLQVMEGREPVCYFCFIFLIFFSSRYTHH